MRVGIMGTGSISIKMTETIQKMSEASCYAVASRSLQRAQAYKAKYSFEAAYGSYEELVSDEKVDLVYIATPHSEHYNNALLAVEHGKAVLCEKSFTVNAKEAEKLIEAATKKGVYLAEAIWTRYMPYRKLVDDILDSGKIGDAVSLSANLGYNIKNIDRLTNPALAGGALLDVGIYPLHFASMFFGEDIEEISTTCTKSKTGVDATNAIILKYKSGKLAILHSTIMGATDQQGIIYGTKGHLIIRDINNPVGIEIYNNDRELVEEIAIPEQITGYEYEVLEAKKAIEEGRVQCTQAPLSVTLSLMKVMDKIRKEWEIKYPFE